MLEDLYEKNKKMILLIFILIIFIVLMTLVYTSSQNNLKKLDEKGCGCNGNKKYDYYDNDKYYNGNNKYQWEQQINQLLAQQATMMQQQPPPMMQTSTSINQQPNVQVQNEVLPSSVARINNGNVDQFLPVVNLPQGNFIQNLPIFTNLSGPVITNIRNQPITATNLRNNVVLNSNDILTSTSANMNQRRFANNLIPRNNKGFDLDDRKLTKKKKSKKRKSKKY